MKIYRSGFVLLLTVIMCLVASVSVFAYHDVKMHEIDEYEYPVVPGTSEWNDLDTFTQRLAACRIPQETLDAMTTEALVNAVKEFPFLGNILIYENTEISYKNLVAQCDALRELLTRPDGPNLLAEMYVSLTSAMKTKSSSDYETYGIGVLYPVFFEIILGQSEVYNGMDYRHQLSIELASKRYNEGEYSYMDRTIENSEENITRAISAPVTPNGNVVPYEDHTDYPQFTNAEKAAGNQYIQDTYTIISVVSDPNLYYNCHSYAWHSTSTSNVYWIPDPSLYMSDGSYSEQSSGSSGDKVFYCNPGTEMSEITGDILGDHSGIVVAGSGNSMIINSKWGVYGVYKHYIYNSAYSGNHTEYSFWDY